MGGSSSKTERDSPKEVHKGKELDGTDFSGPCDDRKCRDVFCCLLLVAAWVAMTGVGFVVTGAIQSENLQAGDPYRLINGMDYMGNICGIDDAVCGTGETNVYGDDCSSSSKNTFDMSYQILTRPKTYYLPSGGAVCVEECPTKDNYNKFICQYDYQSYLSTLSQVERRMQGLLYVSDAYCMPELKTVDYVGYCIPEAVKSAIVDGVKEAGNAQNVTLSTIGIGDGDDDKTLYEKNPIRYIQYPGCDWWGWNTRDGNIWSFVSFVAPVSRMPFPLDLGDHRFYLRTFNNSWVDARDGDVPDLERRHGTH